MPRDGSYIIQHGVSQLEIENGLPVGRRNASTQYDFVFCLLHMTPHDMFTRTHLFSSVREYFFLKESNTFRNVKLYKTMSALHKGHGVPAMKFKCQETVHILYSMVYNSLK